MNTALIVAALLAGWCGTPYPRRFPFPWPFPEPFPKPNPPRPELVPNPVISNILGAVGGLIAYGVLTIAFKDQLTLTNVLVSGFLGGRFINDLGGLLFKPQATKK